MTDTYDIEWYRPTKWQRSTLPGHGSLVDAMARLLALRGEHSDMGYRIVCGESVVAMVAPDGEELVLGAMLWNGLPVGGEPVESKTAAEAHDPMCGLSPDARLAIYPDSLSDAAVVEFMAIAGPMSVPQELGDARSFLTAILCNHARYFGREDRGRDVWVIPAGDNGDYVFMFEGASDRSQNRLVSSEFCWGGR